MDKTFELYFIMTDFLRVYFFMVLKNSSNILKNSGNIF